MQVACQAIARPTRLPRRHLQVTWAVTCCTQLSRSQPQETSAISSAGLVVPQFARLIGRPRAGFACPPHTARPTSDSHHRRPRRAGALRAPPVADQLRDDFGLGSLVFRHEDRQGHIHRAYSRQSACTACRMSRYLVFTFAHPIAAPGTDNGFNRDINARLRT